MDVLFLLISIIGVAYVISCLLNNRKSKDDSNIVFVAILMLAICCYAANIYNFLSDNFLYTAVYEKSSTSLSIIYKISAAHSGQSGSFLLWLLITAAVGLIANKSLNNTARSLFIIFPIIISLALFFNSPFAITDISHIDGLGLSIALQSPYNLLHPPLIFIGFTLLFIPYCITVAILISNDYLNRKLMKILFKYNRYGLLFLLAGMLLGAVWAYNSFGWGGFWNWDIIENAALIPLILSIALLHSGILYIRKEALLKTCYLLSLLIVPTMLLCTFLARSGIAMNLSVHSYASNTNISVWIILFFLIAVLLASIILFLLRISNISQKYRPDTISKHISASLITVFAIIVLLCWAFVVGVGTLLPVLSPQYYIPPAFFMNWTIPLAIIMLILLGLQATMPENKINFTDFSNLILPSFSSAILLMLVMFYIGINRLDYLLIVFSATFATISQVIAYIQKKNNITATIAHLGTYAFVIAAMLFGQFSANFITYVWLGGALICVGITLGITKLFNK